MGNVKVTTTPNNIYKTAELFGVCDVVEGQLVTAGIACNLQVVVNDRFVKRQCLSDWGFITQGRGVMTHQNLKS